MTTDPIPPKHFIPDSVFEQGRTLAKSATFYGVPLGDFTRDELIAIAAIGWVEYTEALQRGAADIAILRSLRSSSK
jgi:hypothetical protein